MKCLSKYCQDEGTHCRGLCRRCYERMKKRVAVGAATWGELIAQGLAKKASRHNGLSQAKRRKNSLESLVRRGIEAKRVIPLIDPAVEKMLIEAGEILGPPQEANGEGVV